MVNVSIDARKNRSDESPITQEQIDKIQKASDEAYAMVKKGANALENIYNQTGKRRKLRRKRRKAWNKNTRVKRWFGTGSLTTVQMKWTKERLVRLKRNLEGTVKFRIIQHQSGDRSWLCHDGSDPSLAYCSGGSSIKLCPKFFIVSDRKRAKNVVHELCHHIAMWHRRTGTGGRATDRKSALKLAKDYPKRARKNPENYEHFCNEYY